MNEPMTDERLKEIEEVMLYEGGICDELCREVRRLREKDEERQYACARRSFDAAEWQAKYEQLEADAAAGRAMLERYREMESLLRDIRDDYERKDPYRMDEDIDCRLAKVLNERESDESTCDD